MSRRIVELGSAISQPVDTLDEPTAITALHGIVVENVEHLEGHVVVHQLVVFQCSEEDRDTTFSVLGLELVPEAIRFLNGRVRRGWR